VARFDEHTASQAFTTTWWLRRWYCASRTRRRVVESPLYAHLALAADDEIVGLLAVANQNSSGDAAVRGRAPAGDRRPGV
jgi:hypothetical protein